MILFFIPSPRAKPWMKVVLPEPKSPFRPTTIGQEDFSFRIFLAKLKPSSFVLEGELLVIAGYFEMVVGQGSRDASEGRAVKEAEFHEKRLEDPLNRLHFLV